MRQFYVDLRYSVPSWTPLICIALHVGFSMIGYLTLPWVMTSELYPLRVRGAVGGLTTSIAQIMTFASIKTYPDMNGAIGLEGTMWTFACASLAGATFAISVLPETRGRSLDQIECRFSGDCPRVENPTNVVVVADTKNVTLKRFASISEEKFPNMRANAYGYDNFSLDVTDEGSMKTNEALTFGKREWKTTSETARSEPARTPVVSTICLEHAYL